MPLTVTLGYVNIGYRWTHSAVMLTNVQFAVSFVRMSLVYVQLALIPASIILPMFLPAGMTISVSHHQYLSG